MEGMSCSASAQKSGSFGGTASGGESSNESRQIHIIEFPAEVLENILRYLPFGTVGKNRLVCRWFNSVCSSILNAEFQHLRILMQQRFQSIKAQMPRRESARRKHPLARESDIIETLHMRLTLLQMSFGKHIERKHCCFFAGEILDEVYKILRYVKTTPNLSRAYKVTDELFDLSTMAMEYFKEHIEPTLPEITYFAADFLDYTPSFSSSPKTQLSLMEGASNAACTSAKTLGGLQAHISEEQPSVKKRIKRLRDNIKRNNNHILVLRRELKLTRQRATAQQKQIIELKARCGDYDKKFQSTSRKLSAILQELSRCTTELQYWRSKSPAVQCTCGKVTPVAELKEVDAAAAIIDKEAVPPIVNGFQFDGGHTFKEEFKPINADVTSCSSATEVLLVPSCHSTPADKVGTANLNLSLIMPAPVEGNAPSSSNGVSELKDGQELKPKACKRKLSMDSSINDVQIAKQTLVPMDVNM